MKIRVTLKDPDSMADSVDAHFKRAPKPEVDDLTEAEWRHICEERASAANEMISHRWMPYGEYLIVEFDTEAGTATVLPASALN